MSLSCQRMDVIDSGKHMKSKTISILGCGWLGLPLARHLVQCGFPVKGSTTTPEKLQSLIDAHIIPYLIAANSQLRGEDIDSFLQSKILFLNIPFKRNLEDPHTYKQQIDSVMSYAQSSPVEFVIFASSTSIYPDERCEAVEDMPFVPDNPRSQVLWEVEQALLKNHQFETTIIRFSGLYGGTRRIGRFLSGKRNLPKGSRPVNLIHLDDCIEIIAQIIEQDIRGETFNACSDEHPTRKELYTKAAVAFGAEPPQFINEAPTGNVYKIVSNRKLKKRLGYRFKHPTFNHEVQHRRFVRHHKGWQN
jgi:nucleoside-diphosphate-sugar epimerase